MAKKRDNRQSGFCFGDLELFGAEVGGAAPVVEAEAPKTIQIVLAWTDMSGMKASGRMIVKDRNYFPEFIPCLNAKAAMWLSDGIEADIEKAERHLNSILGDCITGKVFVYPSNEKEPLDRARKEILPNQ